MRLPESVRAAGQWLVEPAHRSAEVVALQPVVVRRLDRESLAVVSAPQVDARLVHSPRRRQVQAAVRADHVQPLPRRGVERAVDLCCDTVREDERPRQPDVDAGRARHLVRRRGDRLAREQARATDAVAADVHQRAARQGRVEADIVVPEREREGGAYEPELADRAAADELDRPLRLRMVTPHERLHQQPAGAVRGVERLADVVRPACERLLTEHVVPGLERPNRPFDVLCVRQRHVDRLHVGVVEQRVVAAVRLWDAPFARVRSRALRAPARHGEQLGEWGLVQARDDGGVDAGRGEDAPADRLGRVHRHDISVIGRMQRLLVANRGEIALRIFRTCRSLGLGTVAVAAPDDRGSLHARSADATVQISSYLDAAEHVRAARESGADAVHPGYGFLAESAELAEAVLTAGLAWVGPPPTALRAGGDKLAAKETARAAGVPVLPTGAPEELGYPLLVKAAAGGGGRGMRIVRSGGELADAVEAARREAAAAFGDDTVFFERYLERPHHVEIQLLADRHGMVVGLGERECSVQRRHQKVLEESPSPAPEPELRARMSDAAVAFARAIGYESAGTTEFMLDGRDFYFLELNARIQVEHPVTELVAGVDLVREQLRVARGEALVTDCNLVGHA